MTEKELREQLRELLTRYADDNAVAVTYVRMEWKQFLGTPPRLTKVSIDTEGY